MVRAKLSALHPQDVIHHMAGHLGDTPCLGGTCPSHTPAPTHARGHLTPQAASPLSNRDLGGLHPCWDVSSGCGHPGALSWALRAADRAAQLGPKVSNSSAKLQNRLETGPVGVTSYKQEDIGQLGAAPPLASRRGHSGSRPWEAMVSRRPPAPQLPTSLGQLPSGPQLPIHHEAVGAQHPGCFPPPLRVCLEVSGPRSEAGKAGEGRRRRRSRWAAPGPGEGSHSPSSPPLLSEPALSTGSLYDPQSPASCTSTPSLPRAGGT